MYLMITVYLRNLTMIFGNFHKKEDITQSLKNTPPQMYPLVALQHSTFLIDNLYMCGYPVFVFNKGQRSILFERQSETKDWEL